MEKEFNSGGGLAQEETKTNVVLNNARNIRAIATTRIDQVQNLNERLHCILNGLTGYDELPEVKKQDPPKNIEEVLKNDKKPQFVAITDEQELIREILDDLKAELNLTGKLINELEKL